MEEKIRFYRNVYPNVHDVVIVKVMDVQDVGANVILLEYGEIPAVILSSEFAKKRIRSIKQVIRENMIDVATVLRVDEERGYIDLSKSKVAQNEIGIAKEKFEKMKIVMNILKVVAEKSQKSVMELLEGFVWKLHDEYEHIYYFMKSISMGSLELLKKVPEEIREVFYKEIQKRMTPPLLKIRGDFELRCYTEHGIDSIKEALLCVTSEKVKTYLVTSPRFYIQTENMDGNEGVEILERSLQEIQSRILQLGGEFKEVEKPRVLTENESDKLKAMLEKAEDEFDDHEGEEYDEPECESAQY